MKKLLLLLAVSASAFGQCSSTTAGCVAGGTAVFIPINIDPNETYKFVEAIPVGAVTPIYDQTVPYCPRAEFTIKWFIQSRTIYAAPTGWYATEGSTETKELYFKPMCVSLASTGNLTTIPAQTIKIIPLYNGTNN